MRVHARVWFLALICCVLLAGILPAAALAAAEVPVVEKLVATNCKVATCGEEDVLGPFFEPKKEITVKEAKEEGFTEAGGRVPFGVTDFKVLTLPEVEGKPASYAEGTVIPTAIVKHIRTDVAPGLATNPFATTRCKVAEFGTESVPGTGFFTAPSGKCGESEIGESQATVYGGSPKVGGAGDVPLGGTVYNLIPEGPEGEKVANGSHLASLYGVALALPKALTEAILTKVFAEHPLPLESFPGSKAEKEAAKKATEEGLIKTQWFAHSLIKGNVEWGKEGRGTNQGDFHDYFEIETSTALPLVRSRLVFFGTEGTGDFVTNATSCPGHLTTSLKIEDKEGVEAPVKTFTTPIGLEGCPLEFPLKFAFAQATTSNDQPTEFTAEASEAHEPEETDVSQVKSASFTLPEGMTLNPSAAHGLEACTPAQAHEVEGTEKFTETFGVGCPAGSKIGTVTLNVPTLPNGSLTGAAYLGATASGIITKPPFTMYVVANSEQYGISVRLVAHVIPNEATGQVTTVFSSPPEQPFSSIALHFERGILAPVANPLVCGTPGGSASFEPTSQPGAHTIDPFGIAVTGCAASLPFSLSQATANQTTKAGGHTSYTFSLSRGDGNQYVSEVKAELPPGLVGEVPKVSPLCEEKQANSETEACPPTSQIGVAVVKAGAGPTPYEFTGPVFLTNSYKGAPYGLSIKVPAVAGPFNLGTVVTRATITVNPSTAQVIADSVLPRIVKGIPVRLKTMVVNVNKQGFLLNPTSCTTPMNTTSTLSGFTLTNGPVTASQVLTTGFPALTNCSSLKWKPSFKASTSSKTSRANGASLTTTITQASGESNIKSVKVQLPKQLPSRLSTLHKACVASTFAHNPYICPSGSFVGGATVVTPTLPGKLTGAAILVSHAGASFPDLDLVVESPSHVRVILTGNTNIKNGITTTNFASTPDVPVSSVTVNLPTGSHSALGAFGDLCAQPLVMPTTIVSQSGKTTKQNTIITVNGCGVRVVGQKTAGNVAYITVKTFAAGRISGSGNDLNTVYRHLNNASNAASLQVPLSSGGRGRGRPFKTQVRVGFVPKAKGGKSSVAYVTVTFR